MPDHVAKKEKIRTALLENAYTLFMERGFESVSVDDIVTMTGVSRKTFFNYFPSKEHLLRKIAIEWHRQHVGSMLHPPPAQATLAVLREKFIAHMDLIPAHRPVFELIVRHSNIIGIHQAILLPGEAPAYEIQREMLTLFRRAHANRELRPGIPPETAYQSYVTLHNLMPHIWVGNPDMPVDDLRKKAIRMMDILFHGCAAPPQGMAAAQTARIALPEMFELTPLARDKKTPVALLTKRKQDTRLALIMSAFEHFSNHGFDATTVDAIAATAGVSRKTFFNYFESKEQVLYQTLLHWYSDTILRDTPPAEGSSALEILQHGLFNRVRAMSAHREFMSTAIHHLEGFVGIKDALLSHGEPPADATLRYALTLFRQAHANGELAAGMTAECAFHVFIALRNMTLHTWVRHPDKSPNTLARLTQPMLDIVLHGCAAGPLRT